LLSCPVFYRFRGCPPPSLSQGQRRFLRSGLTLPLCWSISNISAVSAFLSKFRFFFSATLRFSVPTGRSLLCRSSLPKIMARCARIMVTFSAPFLIEDTHLSFPSVVLFYHLGPDVSAIPGRLFSVWKHASNSAHNPRFFRPHFPLRGLSRSLTGNLPPAVDSKFDPKSPLFAVANYFFSIYSPYSTA